MGEHLSLWKQIETATCSISNRSSPQAGQIGKEPPNSADQKFIKLRSRPQPSQRQERFGSHQRPKRQQRGVPQRLESQRSIRGISRSRESVIQQSDLCHSHLGLINVEELFMLMGKGKQRIRFKKWLSLGGVVERNTPTAIWIISIHISLQKELLTSSISSEIEHQEKLALSSSKPHLNIPSWA